MITSNSNVSSYWHANSGTYSAQSAQSGRGHCSCGRQCTCPAGQPCRCTTRCVCQPSAYRIPGARHADLWSESGEREIRGRRRVSRTLPARQRAPGNHHPRARAQALRRRRLTLQKRWNRVRNLNSYLANRFGWGRHMQQLGGVLGCATCAPGSQRFMFALARWQRLNGLRPTGMLTPSLWLRIQALLQTHQSLPNVGGGPAMSSDPAQQSPVQEPPLGDDDALPLPTDEPATADASTPDIADMSDSAELGMGFRSRRIRGNGPVHGPGFGFAPHAWY